MNGDLERQLAEMGPEFRRVVDRLCAGREVVPSRCFADAASCARHTRRQLFLLAASLALVVAFAAVFLSSSRQKRTSGEAVFNEYRLATLRSEAAVREIIRTQNADGSWKNDFLTRQNAEALRLCSGKDARIAYKKAMRSLRLRGIL